VAIRRWEMKRMVALSLVSIMIMSSCATLVRIETNVPDAKVKLDGQSIGTTPVEKSLSDGIWENYNIVIEKDGYRTLRTRLNKEFKVGTFIGGLFLWPLLLWVYGPEPIQFFELEKQ
jgi:PEGA domain